MTPEWSICGAGTRQSPIHIDNATVNEELAVFSNPKSGKLLVIGMLYKIGSDNNPFIQTLIDAGLPANKGDTVTSTTSIDVKDGITSTDSYYTYAGSLTTSPCTKSATWVVQKEQATLTHEQWQVSFEILSVIILGLYKKLMPV